MDDEPDMIMTPCVVVCVVGRSNFPLSDAKMKPRVVLDDAAIKLHSKNSSSEMMIGGEWEWVSQVRSLFPRYFSPNTFPLGVGRSVRCLPRRK